MNRFENVISFSFAERLAQGMLDEQEARRIQNENTFYIRKEDLKGVERGGMEATSGDRKMNFNTLADALEWAKQSGGLLYMADGDKESLIAGRKLEDIIEENRVGARKFSGMDEKSPEEKV